MTSIDRTSRRQLPVLRIVHERQSTRLVYLGDRPFANGSLKRVAQL